MVAVFPPGGRLTFVLEFYLSVRCKGSIQFG